MLCARPMPVSSMPPHHTGTPALLAEIVNALGHFEAAYAAQLDIDNFARAHGHGR